MRYTKISIVMIVISILLFIGVELLYSMDHDISNYSALITFIEKENSLIYNSDSLDEVLESSNSISELLDNYKQVRSDELAWASSDVIIKSVSDADELLDSLLPAKLGTCNKYIRPFIYTNAYYDIIHVNNPENDCYHEVGHKLWKEKSLHEWYLKDSLYGFIYNEMDKLVVILYMLIFITASLSISAVVMNYLEMYRSKKNDITRNNVNAGQASIE